MLQQTDKIIRTFPEVEHVFGKIGRAETATDPAPLSMIETTIMLKPESEWRDGMTPQKLIRELNQAVKFPGLTNAWTMPIKTRIDMLSTGIKTPVGIKVVGDDLETLQALGEKIETVVRDLPGTLSVFAERAAGGNYLDFEIDRQAVARYGLTVGDVQDVIMSALGGMNITHTVEGFGALSGKFALWARVARQFARASARAGAHTDGGADSHWTVGRSSHSEGAAEH